MNSKKRIKNAVAQGRGVDSAISQNLAVKNNSVRSTQTRPLRGAKNRIQGCSSATADFLLEADKRGSPPKSEKAAAFWRVGGAGWGVQPFLRKESREIDENGGKIAESSLKIGIVIPIYNVAPYLNECLDSVANQSYGNFHAVLVNDGSVDNSRQIALDYVAKDSRFVLIDKENGGLSSARNAGIKYFKNFAESSLDSANIHTHKNTTPNPPRIHYIIFLDSDDFWEKDLLEICGKVAESSADSAPSAQGVNLSIVDEFLQLHEASDTDRTLSPSRKRGECDCEKSPQDAEFTTPPRFAITNPSIIWFGFKTFGAKARTGDPLDLFAFKDIATISPREWILRAQQAGIGQFWFSWGGMMDFRFLCEKKLQFLEGALYEDELFGVQVFAQSRAICVLPKKLYNYRIRENSLASSAQRKSLPPNLSHLREHFSDENTAWQYFCASSFARILVESVAFFERLDDKALARALKRAFLPTLFARSCDILGFRHDPYLMKARVVELLKANGRYLSVLNLLAKIPHKRTRYTIFLSYFAPRLVWFRVKKRIKLLFVAESSADSANLQNLEEKPNKKIFSKVFASFCFCKKKNPSNPLDSNSSSDLDSAKSGDLRG